MYHSSSQGPSPVYFLSSLSQHFYEGDHYEQSRETSHLRHRLNWWNLPPDISQFLSGEPPRISVPLRLGLEFSLPSGIVVLPLNTTEILPLHCHSSLSSCCPQCCMLSFRHTFSCYRGLVFSYSRVILAPCAILLV